MNYHFVYRGEFVRISIISFSLFFNPFVYLFIVSRYLETLLFPRPVSTFASLILETVLALTSV